ncbi:MAG: hypothetical protein OSJ70_05510 [Bacilli bacterium]|nr:hypothetical protein [Bacilli bacterium]
MESMSTNYDMWNPYTLRQARASLLNMNSSKEDNDELMIITYLLNNDCKICERSDDSDFAKVFAINNHLFEEDYREYMNYIIECYDFQKDREKKEQEDNMGERLNVRPFAKLDVSYEYIMAKLERFMDSLDNKWYDIFYELYLNRRDIIKLSKDATATLYLPESDLWLANVEKRDSIEDFANVAHIYGEGIAAKLRRRCEKTPDSNILIQAFAKAIQYIFITKLDDFGIQREVTNFFTYDYNECKKRVDEVIDRFAINAYITNPKSAKEVASKLNARFGTHVSKTSIENLYKKSVKRDIQKIMIDLILRELLAIYQNDQDKFINDMNALVTSEECPTKTLEKLNIELNSIYKR